jgi:hypothetical protein
VRHSFGELKRVTKPTGTVAAAVWDYGEGMEMLRAFWDEAVVLAPASAARDERNMPLCRLGDLAALWRQHGLQDVVEEGLIVETRFASFDDFWTPFLEKQGPAGAYAASLSAEDREALRLRLRRRLLGTGPDKELVMQGARLGRTRDGSVIDGYAPAHWSLTSAWYESTHSPPSTGMT